MALNASKIESKGTGVEQKDVEPGVYPARFVQIIDFGVQEQRPYMGEPKPPTQEIGLTYELVDEFMKDKEGKDQLDKPRWISEILPLHSLQADKAKSTQRYKAADPNNLYGGDFGQLLETPVNVSIVHNKQKDKTWVNVANIASMRPKDAAACPPLVNPPKLFDLDQPDMAVFAKFPQWIQDKLKKNLNYQGSKLQAALEGKALPEQKKVEAASVVEDDSDKPWD